MTSVLVTGGGGFIGTHWCRTLADAGHTGIVLDCNPQAAPLPDNWRYVQGDVRDVALLRQLCATVSRVVHLAAAHHDAGIPAATYGDVNVNGTVALLDAMDHNGLTDLIFTSSVAVYGDMPGATEQTTPHPVSPYGITKLEAEHCIKAWTTRGAGRSAVVLRPAVVIGPGHFANMFSLMKQIDSGLFVHVGAASNIKSLSSARTVVAAGEWLREQALTPLQVANVVSEPQLSSKTIINAISKAFGRREPRLTIPLSLALIAAGAVQNGLQLIGRSTSISPARVRKLFAAETLFVPSYLAAAGFKANDSTLSSLKEMAEWFLAGGRDKVRQVRYPPEHVTLHVEATVTTGQSCAS